MGHINQRLTRNFEPLKLLNRTALRPDPICTAKGSPGLKIPTEKTTMRIIKIQLRMAARMYTKISRRWIRRSTINIMLRTEDAGEVVNNGHK